MADSLGSSSTAPKPEERVYLEGKNIPYTLPRDAPEHVRLELQAAHLSAVMSNNVLHSPLSNPQKILDVGCGTGIVTTFLANKFPNAQVFGLDLAPVPPVEGRKVPSNIRYVQGNIMDLDGAQDAHLDAGQEAVVQGNFDLIWSRLLVCGMSDWPGYLRKATSLLAPGTGWVEVHDLDATFLDGSGNVICDSWEWLNVVKAAGAERGLDFDCGKKAAGWMQDAGLVDITATAYRWPYGGEWEETEEMKNFGEFVLRDQPQLLSHVVSKVTERKGYSQEQIDKWRQQMKEDVKAEKGKHLKFWVTRGRRPA